MTYPRIIGISGRSATGLSRPFFCDADDGRSYFVKRNNVSWDNLVTEFMISSLAIDFGLPVAPISLMEIPDDLADHAVVDDREELQAGVAFGSLRIPYADDLRESHACRISNEEKTRCLCFDWWVRNHDRRTTLLGGDSNLLWDPILGNLKVIDHDRCLDPDFNPDEFRREHAFREAISFLEKSTLNKLRTKFESAIYSLEKNWENIPSEWLIDPAGESRISLTRHDMESMLIKPEFPVDGMLTG